MRIHITPTQDGYLADVNGTAIPVDGYVMEAAENGQTLVQLLVAADDVSVGRSPSPVPASAVTAPTTLAAMEQAPKLRTWGDRSIPDPREHLGLQVARNAEGSE